MVSDLWMALYVDSRCMSFDWMPGDTCCDLTQSGLLFVFIILSRKSLYSAIVAFLLACFTFYHSAGHFIAAEVRIGLFLEYWQCIRLTCSLFMYLLSVSPCFLTAHNEAASYFTVRWHFLVHHFPECICPAWTSESILAGMEPTWQELLPNTRIIHYCKGEIKWVLSIK